MWNEGHSWDEIDSMSVERYGDILGYWKENAEADAQEKTERENLRRR